MHQEIHPVFAIEGVLKIVDTKNVVKIAIQGSPASGKSTLAQKLSEPSLFGKTKFTIKNLKKSDMIHFSKTLSNLNPGNHILILDDTPFNPGYDLALVNASLNAFMLANHHNTKIIFISLFHNPSIRKCLEPFDAYFLTSLPTSDIDSTSQIMDGNHDDEICQFADIYEEIMKEGVFRFLHEGVEYCWRNPYAPALFYNRSTDSVDFVLYSNTS